jgi:hypothetical protein
MVMTYKYYVPIEGVTVNVEIIAARLNELGAEGWRLTNTIAWFEKAT